MSLVKDEQVVFVVTDTITNSGVPGAPAYSTQENITLPAPQKYLGTDPVVTAQEIVGTNDSTSGRQIRFSTSEEITAMRVGLFGNYIGMVQAYKLFQIQKYYTDYGVPLFILPNGNFISMWWFKRGPAFGTFIGYDPGNPPRQYVKLKLSPLGVVLPYLVG